MCVRLVWVESGVNLLCIIVDSIVFNDCVAFTVNLCFCGRLPVDSYCIVML